MLELIEQLLFLLRCHCSAPDDPLARIDKPGELSLQVFLILPRGHIGIAIEPLLSGREPVPTWKNRGEIYVVPLRMMAGLEQRGKSREEHVDEIGDIVIAGEDVGKLATASTVPTATVSTR